MGAIANEQTTMEKSQRIIENRKYLNLLKDAGVIFV